MKHNVKRINESQLKAIIAESIKNTLNEKHRPSGVDTHGKRKFDNGVAYYPMNNSKKYAQAQGLDNSTMYKVGKVNARPSIAGQQNVGTKLGDFSERDSYTENGNSMIVRNPRGEEYQVPKDEFDRKYTLAQGTTPDENGYSEYNAFDKRQISTPIKHNLYKNMPNWGKGQFQKGRKGDAHIVNSNSNDSYFIGDKELASTHTSNPNINENRLKSIIAKSIKKTLNENTTHSEIIDKFYQIAEGKGMEDFIADMICLCSEEQLKYYVSIYERDGYFDEEE